MSKKINLLSLDTRAPKSIDKEKTKEKTKALLEELDELQNLLFAQSKYSLLILIQGMDASGKDGLVRDVFSAVNPLGVQVKSWKAPTAEELSHDFLWRIHHHTPAKGMIHIHNRSHYEDVLITRVHKCIDTKTAAQRYKAINDFEELLTQHNNTILLKFYLHISPEEQQSRLEERMHIPRKMWKYNENDFLEAKHWGTYMKYYQEAFATCNQIPWHIIPSDQNWYKNYLVASKIVQTLLELKMSYPGLKK
ncbi:MAG: polyphosphate kinase [Chitinophagaceae bacterium]